MMQEVTVAGWLHRFLIGPKGANIKKVTQDFPSVYPEFIQNFIFFLEINKKNIFVQEIIYNLYFIFHFLVWYSCLENFSRFVNLVD